VLRSLGASRRVPIAHILLDNAVVLTLTTALGVVLAGGLYRHAMDIFVPMGPLLELSATAFAANAAVIGAVSAVVVRRHAGKDVVELLEGGT
jgi:predicted lysophospholipase L1 biosynthesis ABC-type transport system permease subunit